MRILFDDDHGNRVAMECTSVSAIRDGYGWCLLAVESDATSSCIIKTGLDETVAKDMVRKLFDSGRLVQD